MMRGWTAIMTHASLHAITRPMVQAIVTAETLNSNSTSGRTTLASLASLEQTAPVEFSSLSYHPISKLCAAELAELDLLTIDSLLLLVFCTSWSEVNPEFKFDGAKTVFLFVGAIEISSLGFSVCWRRTKEVYSPSSSSISSSSALRIVERRWAMMIVVRPTAALSRASCTTRSDSESSALVASSRRSILGDLIMALAIAILCFCPPDI
uniref:Uncharacterized protein n=1 Tax=Solanum lycopersicum TaxID=4081 RepID=A0A3Q7F9Z9_SOLLC